MTRRRSNPNSRAGLVGFLLTIQRYIYLSLGFATLGVLWCAAVMSHQLHVAYPAFFTSASAFAFLAYFADKRLALAKVRRVPEKSLHFMELIGGWPGALIAQVVFRHKTRKLSFQIMTWLMVIVNTTTVAFCLYVIQCRLE